VTRDTDRKRRLYEALGAQEYMLFAPEPGLLEPSLQGYRRAESGRFEALRPDAHGRLWSEVLGLWLATEGGALRAVQPDGQRLLTHEEEAAARAQETAARRRAEEELARLRARLEHDRGET
jgi:hypothetical protein